jgi:hypothetical protein
MRASLSAGVFQRAGLALVSAWRGMHDGEVPKDPAWPSIQDLSECGRDDWKDASLCCLLCLAADLAMTMRQLMCPGFIYPCLRIWVLGWLRLACIPGRLLGRYVSTPAVARPSSSTRPSRPKLPSTALDERNTPAVHLPQVSTNKHMTAA